MALVSTTSLGLPSPTSTVQPWRSGPLELPGDLAVYVVPDALAPLGVNRAANPSTYVRPTI